MKPPKEPVWWANTSFIITTLCAVMLIAWWVLGWISFVLPTIVVAAIMVVIFRLSFVLMHFYK